MQSTPTRRRSLAGPLALLLLLSCPGRALAEWFDDYARGIEALGAGSGAKAADSLERAVKKRPDPGVNLLTYGTNRLERYHPYLRLAEAYMLAGKPQEAREALARSQSRGKEPADERARLQARADAEIDKLKVASAPTPPIVAPTAATPAAPTAIVMLATAAPTSASTQAATAAPSAAGPRTGARAPTGTLVLESDPDGATVLLGTQLLGTTPLAIELPAGRHDLTLRRTGSAELRFPVELKAGQRTSESRTLVPAPAAPPAAADAPARSALVVTTEPPQVTVYVDDEMAGVTDPRTGRLAKSGLAPGPHRVRLSRAGFEDAVEDVTLEGGGPGSIHRALTPARTVAPATIAIAATALAVSVALALVLRVRRRRPGTASHTLSSAVTVPPSGRPAPATVSTPTVGQSSPTNVPGTDPDTLVLDNGPTGARISAAGSSFGEFRLLEQLGKGGMAVVFKAERHGEICALKRPLNALLEDPEFLGRFLREADIGGTLHHPNIIRIFDRGEVDGVPFFTMELVEGETLQARLRRDGALDARTATRLVAQVAEALDYAHLKGVVHRDLKPANIMVLRDGTLKVMDYGIARARRFEGLTATGAFLGTPDYVAPETAEGKGTDARSDLYSLGIVFYEIVTGRRPFRAETPFALIRKHCVEPPPPPTTVNAGVPPAIEAIILKLLSKNPEDRYPGAEELLVELRAFLHRAA
jgi:hypothetical protein